MYTTIIHPIRKELNLSCNEYVILDCIYQLSNNEKFGGWCIASKDYFHELFDISRPTVFRAIENLVSKELVKKGPRGALKTTDKWHEITTKWHESIKMRPSQSQNDTNSLKMIPEQSQNETPDSIKMRRNINIYNNINNNNPYSPLTGTVEQFPTSQGYRAVLEVCSAAGMKLAIPYEFFKQFEAQYEVEDIADAARAACSSLLRHGNLDGLGYSLLQKCLADRPMKTIKKAKQTDDEQVEEFLKLTQNQNATNTKSV